MRIEIEAPEWVRASEPCRLRAILLNDSYEAVPISRNSFVGPSLAGEPQAVEATFGGAEEPLVLQPFTFYGRERTHDSFSPGEVEVTASYHASPQSERLTASRRIRVEPG